MLRILSGKRYWSLISRIAEDQKTIKDQADLISNQQKSIEYLNGLLSNRRGQIYLLQKRLADAGLNWTDINFPNTEPDNQISIYDIFNN